jgi:hypothetical protein
MPAPEHFEIEADHASYGPVGEVSLDQGVALISDAIAYAAKQNIENLLVDTTGLTGFPTPNVTDRYWFARQWAAAARRGMKVVMVARPEMIDPEKFGVTVARNAGLVANVFATKEEALAWLLDSKAR